MIGPQFQYGHLGPKPWPQARRVWVSHTTGPLRELAEKRIVCVVDYQNLSCSAADLGLAIRWPKLAEVIRSQGAATELYLVLSDRDAALLDVALLREAGWKLAVKRTGVNRYEMLPANADNLFSFLCGKLSHRQEAELYLLGTGDGELALDAAQMLVAAAPAAEVGTISLAGSTSRRLDARLACDIDFNLEVGLDCLA